MDTEALLKQAESLLQPEWARAQAADLIIRQAPVDIEFLGGPAEATVKDPRFLKVRVEALSEEPRGGLLNLRATWRLRYHRGGYDPQAEPAGKVGIIQAGPFQLGEPYQPGDRFGAGLGFQQTALPELIKRANNQDLLKALSKE